MNGYNRVLNTTRNGFFKKDNAIDDEMFHEWKNELEKEIPTFWEEIVKKP